MGKRIQFRRQERSDLETQFWLRVLAFTVDSFIVRLLILPILTSGLDLVIGALGYDLNGLVSDSFSSTFGVNSTILVILYLIVFLLYSSLLESSKLQGTVGKWFLRYKVCDTKSNRISFPKALLRNILKVISIISVIGVALIDMTPKRQGLHDLIVGTILIKR